MKIKKLYVVTLCNPVEIYWHIRWRFFFFPISSVVIWPKTEAVLFSSRRRTQPSIFATAVGGTSWSSLRWEFSRWLDRSGLRHGLSTPDKCTRGSVFKMTFSSQVWDKKLKLHFQCPQTRRWNGVMQIKLTWPLLYLSCREFLYRKSTAKDSPVLTKSVLSFRFQQVIKKFTDEILSLTGDIFQRSETRYELIVSFYIMSSFWGQFHWYFKCEKHFYSLKNRFIFCTSSDAL